MSLILGKMTKNRDPCTIQFSFCYFVKPTVHYFLSLTDGREESILTNIALYFVYLLISIKYFSYCSVQNNIYVACKKGYNGTNCKQKCPFPSYGLSCQRKCNCIDKVCDHVNGCMQPTTNAFHIKGNYYYNNSNFK